MTHPQGGFYSSLDADSEHEEGKFYVWSEAEIDAVLGATAPRLFKRFYDVTAGGNWEGKNILNRLAHPALADDATEAELARVPRDAACRRAPARVRPGLDDKVLADWNGLMIAALADAGLAFDRAEWIDARRPRLRFHPRRDDRSQTAGCCTAGARGRRGTRPASTITPICAAPRWRCTRRPRDAGLSGTGAALGRSARPALLGRSRRRVFLRRRRHAGPDRARQDRRRRRGAVRQRHDGRGADPARAVDRRATATASAPKRSSRRSPASSGATSSRSRR